MKEFLRANPGRLLLATFVVGVGVGVVAVASTRGSGPGALGASTDSRAIFDAALRAQERGRYHDAREGYLRALSVDPKFADARFQLAVLTHTARAEDEARHHLEELEAIAPNDPRVPGLRALLPPEASVR